MASNNDTDIFKQIEEVKNQLLEIQYKRIDVKLKKEQSVYDRNILKEYFQKLQKGHNSSVKMFKNRSFEFSTINQELMTILLSNQLELSKLQESILENEKMISEVPETKKVRKSKSNRKFCRKCPGCKKQFSSYGTSLTDEKFEHCQSCEMYKKLNFLCQQCELPFMTSKGLKQHLKSGCDGKRKPR